MLNQINSLISDLDSQGLEKLISNLNLSGYHQTRNYLDGNVTKLSPLITHGVITIPEIVNSLNSHNPKDCAGFIFQLGWREYFQKIWQNYNPLEELRSCTDKSQSRLDGVPSPILEQTTGIHLIDQELCKLITSGYIHNHSRLWIASLITHFYNSSWRDSAQWMYYHLLDGCPASNFLSWQWVYGSFSKKRYLFNQENLNKFSKTNQIDTLIDCDYSKLSSIKISVSNRIFLNSSLITECQRSLERLSNISKKEIQSSSEILIYSIFTLDRNWQRSSQGLKVLWLDPTFFKNFPISHKRIELIRRLVARIPELKVYYGELSEYDLTNQKVSLKDHPIFKDWKLKKDQDSYLLPEVIVSKDRSYFWYWKQIAKSLSINYP